MTMTWREAAQHYKNVLNSTGYTLDSEFGRNVWNDFFVPVLHDDQPKHSPFDIDSDSVKGELMTQYQALLPLDLERHLYSGATLYDLEKHEFRKISSVVTAQRRSGFSKTITFVGGAKRILTSSEALDDFAKSHKWVSLRDVLVPYTTTHHFYASHENSYTSVGGDTGITVHGIRLIDEKIADAIKQHIFEQRVRGYSDKAERDEPKRRWFR